MKYLQKDLIDRDRFLSFIKGAFGPPKYPKLSDLSIHLCTLLFDSVKPISLKKLSKLVYGDFDVNSDEIINAEGNLRRLIERTKKRLKDDNFIFYDDLILSATIDRSPLYTDQTEQIRRSNKGYIISFRIDNERFWEAKFKEYLQKIVSNNRFSRWAGEKKYIEQEALTPEKSEEKSDLLDYVEETKEFKKRRLQGEEVSPESVGYISGKILDFLEKPENKKALIVGEPGIGKTSAVEKHFYDIAFEESNKKSPEIIPIFLESKFASNKTAFFVMIIEGLKDVIPDFKDLRKIQLDELIKKGRILLILDGFNEITNEVLREKIEDWINHDNRKKLKCIITTRKFFHPLELRDFKRFELKNFGRMEDIPNFLKQHYSKNEKDIFGEIEKQNLWELAEVPFYLNAIGKVYKPDEELPSTKGKLLEKLIEVEYLKKHERIDVAVADEDIIDVLSIIAFKINKNKGINWEFGFDNNRYNEIVSKLPSARKPGKDFKNKILKTGLLHNIHKEFFFTHQILSEYFAALELKRCLSETGEEKLTDEDFQKDFLNFLKWTEPISLMMGLIDDLDQVKRVVELALDVDLMLGARLAGLSIDAFQEETISLINRLNINDNYKNYLLGLTLSDYSINSLLKCLCYENSFSHGNTIISLYNNGSIKAIKALINISMDCNLGIRIREFAIEYLCKLCNDDAIDSLVKMMNDDNRNIRDKIFISMRNYSSDAVVKAFKNVLNHKYKDVRIHARGALARLEKKEDYIFQNLEDADKMSSVELIRGLGKLKSDKSLDKLKQIQINGDKNSRYEVLNAIVARGDEKGRKLLLQALKDDNIEVIRRALDLVGAYKYEDAVESLIELMNHKNVEIRTLVLYVIIRIGKDEAFKKILEKLQIYDTSTEEERELDTYFDNSECLKPFYEIMKTDKRYLKQKTVELIYEIANDVGYEKTIKFLVSAIKDNDVGIIAESLIIKLGANVSWKYLMPYLEENNMRVRISIISSLCQTGSTDVIKPLIKVLKSDEDDFVRSNVIYALYKYKEKVKANTFIKALNDEDSGVRNNAAYVLGQLKCMEAADKLIFNYNRSQINEKRTISSALLTVGGEKALKFLIKSIDDDDFTINNNAEKALKELEPISFMELLKNKIENDNSINYGYFNDIKSIQNKFGYYDPKVTEI